MPDKETLIEEIKKLITKYKVKDKKTLKDLSEANVRKDFIDPLFEVLGWDVRNADEYDAESYVRGVGFADVAIKVDENPKMFIEAKKFGGVPSHHDRSIQTTLKGYKIYADWTEEERQVLNYAGATVGVKWAILTNFEKLRLFNAKTGETVLNIEKPDEYLEKIEDVFLLTNKNVSNDNINKLEERVERPDVDLHFLNLIKKWQLILANEIYNNDHSLSLEEINLFVQRILDRLVIVRYAEDNWVLNNPDQLKAIRDSALKSDYVSLTDMLINFFNGFDDEHDSKIFEKNEEINEIIRNIDDNIFNALIGELYNQSFRKFTSDILGNTYESYLGSKLCLEEDKLSLEYEHKITKEQGIYYTPTFIVNYIVQNSLGKKLEELWNEVKKLFEMKQYDDAVSKFKEIYNIKVLDPSCGSGSFLIKAHDLFVKYYLKYSDEIKNSKKELRNEIVNKNINSWEYEILKNKLDEPLKNYEKRILKKNIYGVDLDENAAEIASVNLMLRALKPHEKLPLILYENIKVGNSIITGVENKEELIEHSEQIKELIQLREKIKITSDLTEKKKNEKEHDILKKEINDKLNENLLDFYDNLEDVNSFNWEIEFPEVFYNENGELKENGGFDVLIGNPPYIRVDNLKKEDKTYWKKFYNSSMGKYDIYYLFIENIFKWLKSDGDCGFIVPNRFSAATSAKKLREILLNFSNTLSIVSVSNLDIFKTASNYPLILQVTKGENLEEIIVKSAIDINSFLNHDFITYEIDMSNLEYLPDKIIPININQSQLNLVINLIKNNERLSSYVKISEGLRIPQKSEVTYKEKYEILKQFQFDRYSDISEGSYISQDNLNRVVNSNSERFLNILKEKIVIAEDALQISSTLDEKFRVPQGGVYFGVLINEELSLKYILTLINSSLLSFVYQILFGGMHMGGGYLRYRTEFLGHLPIKLAPEEQQKEFETYLKDILILNKQKMQLLSAVTNLINNSSQNRFHNTLKYYTDLRNAKDYSINLTKSEKLINPDKKGKPRKYKIYEQDNFVFINVTYENGSNEDVIKLYFEEKILRNFFYLTIYASIEGKTKAYRSDKEILDTVLNDIKIPQSIRNKETDIDNIKILMKNLEEEYNERLVKDFKDSPVQEFNLEIINQKIKEIDSEINKNIHKLYGLTDEEIKIVKKYRED